LPNTVIAPNIVGTEIGFPNANLAILLFLVDHCGRIIYTARFVFKEVYVNEAALQTTPTLPNVLNHLRTIGTFAFAKHPAAIATAWKDARNAVNEYGVGNGVPCPSDFDGAQAFKKKILCEVQPGLSRALIVRAAEIDNNRLNGHGRMIADLGNFVDKGVITSYAGDVLVESAALVMNIPRHDRHISLAQLLEASVAYLSDADNPSDAIIERLAPALEHHGITMDMLHSAKNQEERAELLMRTPHFSMELENRLLRIMGHVRTYEQLEDQYNINHSLIHEATDAGIISRAAGKGALNILRDRDVLFHKELISYGLYRGGAIVLTTVSLFAFTMFALHFNVVPPREAKALIGTSLFTGLSAVYCGARWLLSPHRKTRD
jgi:hypothetical protein